MSSLLKKAIKPEVSDIKELTPLQILALNNPLALTGLISSSIMAILIMVCGFIAYKINHDNVTIQLEIARLKQVAELEIS